MASAQSLPDSVTACLAEQNDTSRLVCFDREVRRASQRAPVVAPVQTEAARTAASPPVVAPLRQEDVRSASTDEFGLSPEMLQRRNQQRNQASPPVEELVARVTKVSKRVHGEIVLELDNGQVWAQPERKANVFIRPGDEVRITRGSMGSYFLAAESGSTTRIRRER